jgi:hypothetical protein
MDATTRLTSTFSPAHTIELLTISLINPINESAAEKTPETTAPVEADIVQITDVAYRGQLAQVTQAKKAYLAIQIH